MMGEFFIKKNLAYLPDVLGGAGDCTTHFFDTLGDGWAYNGTSLGADALGGDGDCATDFFFSKGTGWSHDAVNEEYDCDGSQTAESSLLASPPALTIGTTYKITITVKNYSAGQVRVLAGNSAPGTWRTADNTYSEFLTCAGDVYFRVRADADFVGSVDDITVEPVTAGQYDCDGSQAAASTLTEASVLASGTTYKIVFTVSNRTAGQVKVVAHTIGGTYRAADGTYTEYLQSDGANFIVQGDADFVGTVDDITIQPVAPSKLTMF